MSDDEDVPEPNKENADVAKPAAWITAESNFDLAIQIALFTNSAGAVVDPRLPQKLFEVVQLKGKARQVLKWFVGEDKADLAKIAPSAIIRCVEVCPFLMDASRFALPQFMLESSMLGYYAIEANAKSYCSFSPALRDNVELALFACLRGEVTVFGVPPAVINDPAFHGRFIRILLGLDTRITDCMTPRSAAMHVWNQLSGEVRDKSYDLAVHLADACLFTKPAEIPDAFQVEERFVKGLFLASRRALAPKHVPFTASMGRLKIFQEPDVWNHAGFVETIVEEHPKVYVTLADAFKKRDGAMKALLRCRPKTASVANALLQAFEAMPRPNAYMHRTDSWQQYQASGWGNAPRPFPSERLRFYANQGSVYDARRISYSPTSVPYTWLVNETVLRHVLFERGAVGVPLLVRKMWSMPKGKPLLSGPPVTKPDTLVDNENEYTAVEQRAYDLLLEAPKTFFWAIKACSHNCEFRLPPDLAAFAVKQFEADDADGDYTMLEVARSMCFTEIQEFGFWGRMKPAARARRLADTAPSGFCSKVFGAKARLFFADKEANRVLRTVPSLAIQVLGATPLAEPQFVEYFELNALLANESFLKFCFDRLTYATYTLKWMLAQPLSSSHRQTASDPTFVKNFIIHNELLPAKGRQELYQLIPVERLSHEVCFHATKAWGVRGEAHQTGLFDEVETRLLRIAARNNSTQWQLASDGRDDGVAMASKKYHDADVRWLRNLEYDLRAGGFAPSCNWKVPHRAPAGVEPGDLVPPLPRPLAELPNDLDPDAEPEEKGLRQLKTQLEHYARAVGEITRIEQLRDGGSRTVREFYQVPGHGIRVVFRKTFDPPPESGGAAVERWGLLRPGTKHEIKLPAALVADMPSSHELQMHGVLCATGLTTAAAQRAFYKKVQQKGAIEETDITGESAVRLVVQRIGRTCYEMRHSMQLSFKPLAAFLGKRQGRLVSTFVSPVRGEQYVSATLKLRKQQASQAEVPDAFVLVSQNSDTLVFERENGEIGALADRIAHFLETGPLAVLEQASMTGATIAKTIKAIDQAARDAHNPCVYRRAQEGGAKKQRVGEAGSSAAVFVPAPSTSYVDSSDSE